MPVAERLRRGTTDPGHRRRDGHPEQLPATHHGPLRHRSADSHAGQPADRQRPVRLGEPARRRTGPGGSAGHSLTESETVQLAAYESWISPHHSQGRLIHAQCLSAGFAPHAVRHRHVGAARKLRRRGQTELLIVSASASRELVYHGAEISLRAICSCVTPCSASLSARCPSSRICRSYLVPWWCVR